MHSLAKIVRIKVLRGTFKKAGRMIYAGSLDYSCIIYLSICLPLAKLTGNSQVSRLVHLMNIVQLTKTELFSQNFQFHVMSASNLQLSIRLSVPWISESTGSK